MGGSGIVSQPATTTLRSFYTFLSTLPRLPPSAIHDAPPTGWPALTDPLLANLGPKIDAVYDFLQHLPVISAITTTVVVDDQGGTEETGEGNALIAPSTTGIRWDDGDWLLRWALLGRDAGTVDGLLSPYGAGGIPPHVAV